MAIKLRPRERDAILQSLRSGVTPRTGFQYIQVGRVKEISAILQDINRIADEGSAFKLVVGDFGAGKSFFLQLVKTIAEEKGIVTMTADLTPERRLQSTNGFALNLYQELTHNISTRAKPNGNALNSIVEKFITKARLLADESNRDCEEIIKELLLPLTDFVGGYDFSSLILKYWQAFDEGDTDTMQNIIKWLRGEYTSRITARQELNVRTIITDASIYDSIKILSAFVQIAGYKGLLVSIDEMVNLYKIPNVRARTANYEQILRMLNDCLQGNTKGLGFIFGGTPDFLEDPRRGLHSYEALRSRLATNSFAMMAGVNDMSGPVMYLTCLTPEELYVLLTNLRNIFAYYNEDNYLVPDEALTKFLEHCSKRIGEAYFKTPRNTIKAFVDFLSVLEQNPELDWRNLLGSIEIKEEEEALGSEISSMQQENNDDISINQATPKDALKNISESSEDCDDDDALTSFTL